MAKDELSVNIEDVFIGLRRAWYPPSTAVTKSFTELTQRLVRIFDELRTDPDLGDLHGELYRDLPGSRGPRSRKLLSGRQVAPRSSAARRLRKGFYFCNSLIQLMEDAYIDLQLELTYRHPDTRGWMNLFRHWSHSDTFRMTWAIAAATYGHRFQDFCSRRLGLSLGMTDLKSVWDRTFSPQKDPPQLHPLHADEAPTFDNSETRLIEMICSPSIRGIGNRIESRVEQVLVARLLVPSNRTAELAKIGNRALTSQEREDLLSINYAVVVIAGSINRREGSLLTLSVRRHMRGQGLGRRLMHDIVSRLGVRRVQVPEAAEMLAVGLPDQGRRIKDMFRSVVNETDLSEMRRQERRQNKGESASAVFGLVPPLPYSGVVRPPGVTWAHAIGFCFWVLAGADGISEVEEEAVRQALSDWAGQDIDSRETDSVANESKKWYLSAKRPAEALRPEVDTIVNQMLKQSWFDRDHKHRLAKGFDLIAKADNTVSDVEKELVLSVKDRLGLKLKDEDKETWAILRMRVGLPLSDGQKKLVLSVQNRLVSQLKPDEKELVASAKFWLELPLSVSDEDLIRVEKIRRRVELPLSDVEIKLVANAWLQLGVPLSDEQKELVLSVKAGLVSQLEPDEKELVASATFWLELSLSDEDLILVEDIRKRLALPLSDVEKELVANARGRLGLPIQI